MQQLCSVFRAMPFWSEGALAIAQDAPEDFAYIFNQTNVTEAGFNYSGSSLKTRHTCVSVKYFDLICVTTFTSLSRTKTPSRNMATSKRKSMLLPALAKAKHTVWDGGCFTRSKTRAKLSVLKLTSLLVLLFAPVITSRLVIQFALA